MTAILLIIGAATLIGLISAIDCSMNINVTDYDIPMEGMSNSIKAVCLSDLHGWSYGRDNRKLLTLVEEQKPSVILVLGDMITRRAGEKQKQKMLILLESLTDIAPTIYAMGNHENDYMLKNGMDWLEMAAKTGVKVLYDSFTDVTIGETVLRIGGAAGRYFDGSERDNITLNMLDSIGKDGLPSVAVVHQPENIFNQEKRSTWTADLYLSGHTHGGVWRMPFIGGLMSPAEGLFPKYDRGFFELDGMRLIINGGLSGYYFIPRVFNRPEICKIILEKK